jgi:hypothetical protein
VPDPLFNAIVKVANRLGISRAQFARQAIFGVLYKTAAQRRSFASALKVGAK